MPSRPVDKIKTPGTDKKPDAKKVPPTAVDTTPPGKEKPPAPTVAVGTPIVVPPPPEVISPPTPRVPDQIVDCNAPTYLGGRGTEASWPGVLAPNATLVLGRNKADAPGGLTIKGRLLPGCDVTVKSLTTGVEIVEPPSAANKFSRIRLKNVSSSPVSPVTFRWDVR